MSNSFETEGDEAEAGDHEAEHEHASHHDDAGAADTSAEEGAGGHDDANGAALGPAGGAMPDEAANAPARSRLPSAATPYMHPGLQADGVDPTNLPSSMRLKAEKTGLYAKKFGARALDSALFATHHLVDQASIADVHAVDAMNFVASGGKSRARRKHKGIADAIDYDPKMNPYKAAEKGGAALRENGRTGARATMSSGQNPGNFRKMGNQKPVFEWGKSVTGVNPVSELRKASAPVEFAPKTKDNMRIRQIKHELKAKKAQKKGEGRTWAKDRHGDIHY